ncbi:MAG: MFS transporter [Spirochaetaceae bacterium]|jgi:OPA family glycerol-3-phosphate transporter-like MFS transporter/OPA family sugar phosphate sensor protein UhpC-like MFS transporter|nr:MFS transporter [Spirochaetaceae bacterium]
MDKKTVSEVSLQMTPEEKKKFMYWQLRTIAATWLAYSFFYIVRKNLSMSMPAMQEDLGITKTELGIFLTLHGLLYGVSRFANGFIVHKWSARTFMATGLIFCAACNIIFGFSSMFLIMGLVWLIHGWFQGMGYPPMARLLPHWIPPNELATKMAIWNTSHSVGAMTAVISCGYIVTNLGWRYAFYIPAVLAILIGIWLWFTIRDTPSSVGLPELEIGSKDNSSSKESKEYKQFIKEKVFKNPYIWIIAIANFFVYILRFAILDWGPTILKDWKGFSLVNAGWATAAFEISGIAGVITAGWITDKFFGSRGLRVCVILMALSSLFLFLFWKIDSAIPWLPVVFLMLAGFCIYGPQALVGIASANMATKRGSAVANGFAGLWGYASVIVTGLGVGLLTDKFGWEFSLGTLIGAGIIGAGIFALAWGARADGYE